MSGKTDEPPVRVAVTGPVLVVTLDRPKANAIDVTTSRELHAAFDRLRRDDELRAAVITGGGDRFFSAGWDLKAAAGGEAVDADHGPGGFAGLTEFFDVGKPVIAAVNGLAVGGGFELALAADLIVAAEHAEFALPETGLGIVPDSGGVLRLPRRLPRPVAMDMLLTGRRMGAREAEHWGLVNRAVPASELLDEARAWGERVAASAPLAVAAVAEITAATEDCGVEAGFARMRGLPGYQRMLSSQDAAEGPRAFAEKRRPRWSGN
ncbi:enoyl-CoA hydratase-related protein [Saccharopolyspora sp. SCSIO 74807]|uniref:enoyl-CoA hydratase-related protein n=1 Tax=Saccharopolyspora sp. SCSIO 74807 TaxID=3118084 RepID=UPI0030CEBBBB